jgi:hypothetical protein
MIRLSLFLLFLMSASACTVDEQELGGTWQAVAFFENGKSVNLPLDSVQLKLLTSHVYQYRSIGLYAEAGYWESTVNYLLLTDTTSANKTQRLIKVVYQSSDSLKLKMEQDGKEQVLFFHKKSLPNATN